VVEVGEYLASHVEAGQYSTDDLQDSPEISCLEQIAAEARRRSGGTVPRAISR
jgi:hypothetical protein